MEPFAPSSSAAERDDWLEAISSSIEEYAKKRITFCPSRSLDEVLLASLLSFCPCFLFLDFHLTALTTRRFKKGT